MKTTILRDTNYSFLETTIKDGRSFNRKLEKGSTEYTNACIAFHQEGTALKVGNKVEK